ncbi:hypothetical protein UA08_03966 [Talaromyces atroroseus]|uniref:Fungal lipase-type domain-containing protein n=1 Tax=Talaromyces atroroseus TaxID=1441469 RepID=A0A1Q5Q974_TALAT|nr:hypothetical protein UA08_03966 [Talaromyces atroroseus]OKL60686.1 hypothetical protein UA08_03966 [Talaromyces atroroseus]
MEHMDIPKTLPPPYQSLPPTPALSTASVHAPDQALDYQDISFPSVNPSHHQTAPGAGHYAPHTCTYAYGNSYHAYPRHHAFPLNLLHRPGIRRCGRPITYYQPAWPVYYAHTGREPALAAAPFVTPPPLQQQQHRKQSYLQLGSLSATLNDAGNLAVEAYDALVYSSSTSRQYRGVMDAVALRLDDVLTSIDDGTYRARPTDIAMSESHAIFANSDATASVGSLASPQASLPEGSHKHLKGKTHRCRTSSSSASTTKVNVAAERVPDPFSKAYQYANAYTSSALPPLKLYTATWPLICLASTYSRRAYEKPSSKERQNYISGDWRRGTKAVVIKSVPLDEKNTIVLAIRGTQNFQDWTVNIRTEPTAPTDFLDDEGNLCHAGFLSVARKMIKPAAEHLQDLLRENPRRTSCSLVITGHSAGGAVAALLYCHMVSRTVATSYEIPEAFSSGSLMRVIQ